MKETTREEQTGLIFVPNSRALSNDLKDIYTYTHWASGHSDKEQKSLIVFVIDVATEFVRCMPNRLGAVCAML